MLSSGLDVLIKIQLSYLEGRNTATVWTIYRGISKSTDKLIWLIIRRSVGLYQQSFSWHVYKHIVSDMNWASIDCPLQCTYLFLLATSTRSCLDPKGFFWVSAQMRDLIGHDSALHLVLYKVETESPVFISKHTPENHKSSRPYRKTI
jgi:hypothetical protein